MRAIIAVWVAALALAAGCHKEAPPATEDAATQSRPGEAAPPTSEPPTTTTPPTDQPTPPPTDQPPPADQPPPR